MQTIATNKSAVAATALPIEVEQSTSLSDGGGNGIFKGILSSVSESDARFGPSPKSVPEPAKQQVEATEQGQYQIADEGRADKQIASGNEARYSERNNSEQAHNTNIQANTDTHQSEEESDTDWVAFVERIIADAGADADSGENTIVDGANFFDSQSNSQVFNVDILNADKEYKAIKGEFTLTLPIDTNLPIEPDNGRVTQDYKITLSEQEIALIQSVHDDKIPTLGENDKANLTQLAEDIIHSLALPSENISSSGDGVTRLSSINSDNIADSKEETSNGERLNPQVTLLSTLLGEEQKANSQGAEALEDINLLQDATPPSASLASETKPAEFAKLADKKSEQNQLVLQSASEHIELVVESVLSEVSDSPEKVQLTQGLRADLSSSIVEQLSKNQTKSDKPTLSFQQVVEEALSAQTSEVAEENYAGIALQASKTEQVIAIAHAITDAVVKHQTSPTGALDQNNPANNSSINNDATFIASLDKLSVEGATQVSEQNKLTNPIPPEKAIPLHQPEGQKQVAEKIRWMVGARVTAAEIRLDPPELGSMQIRINMTGDTASVNMVVQSTQARDMLAEAQPRLREMLSEQGIDLGESFVSTQDQQSSDQQASEDGNASSHFGTEHDEELSVIEQPIQKKQSPYNVDAYV